MSLKVSLIIATYNWPQALQLVLNSVLRQTILPDEVIIADDGSGEPTKTLINRFQENFPVPLIHLWHEDKGFRLAEIRNKAIARIKYEYIIQIDGDTVLHKDFIRDHKKLAAKNCFISGSRVLINNNETQKRLISGDIDFSMLTTGITNRLNTIHLPFINIFSIPKNKPIDKLIYNIRGCNMGFWRMDIHAVNGYDERFIGWGREDSELAARLFKKGLYLKRIKMAAIQYHLHHKENDRNGLTKNHEFMTSVLNQDNFFTDNGIVKHIGTANSIDV